MNTGIVPASIGELAERFKLLILARGRTPKHANDTFNRVVRVLQEATITGMSDLRSTQVELGIGRLRTRGLSLASCNHHLRAIKSFSRFLLLDGVLSIDVLARLRMLNARKDQRHARRALTQVELISLLETARNGGTVRGMNGPARYALYLLALTSGLRSGELRALRVADLACGDDGAFVRLDARWTKDGRHALLPIPHETAAALQAIVRGKQAADAVFAMPQPSRVVMMLRADLKLAGVDYIDDRGQFADFHSLRHTYISHLARLTDVKVVQSLARHATVTMTMDRYCHAEASEQRKAVDSLAQIWALGGLQ